MKLCLWVYPEAVSGLLNSTVLFRNHSINRGPISPVGNVFDPLLLPDFKLRRIVWEMINLTKHYGRSHVVSWNLVWDLSALRVREICVFAQRKQPSQMKLSNFMTGVSEHIQWLTRCFQSDEATPKTLNPTVSLCLQSSFLSVILTTFTLKASDCSVLL